MKIVVLDGYTLCPGDLDFSALERFGEVTVYDRTPADQTVCRIGDPQIVITNKVLITSEVTDACPQMKYVGVTARALESGQVAWYMADVMDSEPPKSDDPLLSAPNTVLTLHVAWAPLQTRQRLLGTVVRNVEAFVCGHPQNVVS